MSYPRAYYNEHDRFAAQFLRNLIAAGLIADGDVDERSIEDVRPVDLAGYTQCHFFAGVGVWSYGLRLAGWPDDRPVWTGSCPCQPFSAAGQGGGFDDERHLWPAFHWLIRQRGPDVVLGEQVASKDGLSWLDLVSTDMEAAGYAIGAVDTCSAGHGVGWGESQAGQWLRRAIRRLPDGFYRRALLDFAGWADGSLVEGGYHIRQRLRFAAFRLADADNAGLEGRWQPGCERAAERIAGPGGVAGRVADAHGAGRIARDGDDPSARHGVPVAADRQFGGGGDAEHAFGRSFGEHGENGCDRKDRRRQETHRVLGACGKVFKRPGASDGDRATADWLFCRDGKWRPVSPGTLPLAHEAPARVGRLRAYGNAVDAIATRDFIEAVMEAAE